MTDTTVRHPLPDLTRTGPAAHALFFDQDESLRPVPASVQVFIVEDDGTRTPIDFFRHLRHPDISNVQISAELLGVPPGTPAEVWVTRPTGRILANDIAEQVLSTVIQLTIENVGVVSGVATAGLPVGTVIQSICNRSITGRFHRTDDGWHCAWTDSPNYGPRVAELSPELIYRVVS